MRRRGSGWMGGNSCSLSSHSFPALPACMLGPHILLLLLLPVSVPAILTRKKQAGPLEI